MTAAPQAPRSSRRDFLVMFPSIALPIFLAVVDQTIVATALPAIGAALGDVSRLSWIVVAYLVAATIAAPVYGRLGDVLGRRRLMFVALAVVAVASVLCAASTSVEMLTAARILQGFGGGGLMTLAQAMIGETVPARERGRYQGYVSTVAVSASTFGPVVGGLLTEYFGWQSVFLFNLPLVALAAFLALRLATRPGTQESFRFDLVGLVLFAIFISSILMTMEMSQDALSGRWLMPAVLLAVGLSAAALLVRQENRAPSPLLPIPLLRTATIWRSDAMAACHGASLVSLVTFLPFYLRMAHGTAADTTGLLLLPLTIGVGLGSLTTGRLMTRTGHTAIFPSCGLLVVTVAMAALAFAAEHLTALEVSLSFGGIAFFMGTVMGVVQLTVQMGAGPHQLGAGAASVQFSRSLGAATGTALVGAVLFSTFAMSGPEASGAFGRLLHAGPEAVKELEPAIRATIETGVDRAFRNAFLCIAALAGIGSALAWSLPLRRI